MAVSKKHREESWKRHECQRCGKKIAKQYRAERHGGGGKWGKGKVRFTIEEVQSASPSHYCADCAEKRKRVLDAWAARENGEAKPAAKPRQRAKAKAAE